ncbi:MAG: cyanophycinase [Gemmatimonadales bacterium]
MRRLTTSATRLAVVAGLAMGLPGAAVSQTAAARGSLFIVGGGTQPDELVRRFVTVAGASRPARIAVIPLAASDPGTTGRDKVTQLRALGVWAEAWLPTRADADREWGPRVDSLTAIWFSGGDQERITAILGGTRLAEAIRAGYRAGLVIGGTSAGAAIMPDSMFTGRRRTADSLGYFGDTYPSLARGTIEIVPGLGFLPNVLVDQHFVRRERHNRLLAAVLERPSLIGVGIDEGTALEVRPDGSWRVWGVGTASVYDARRATFAAGSGPVPAAAGVILHVLVAGSVFEPATGAVHFDSP